MACRVARANGVSSSSKVSGVSRETSIPILTGCLPFLSLPGDPRRKARRRETSRTLRRRHVAIAAARRAQHDNSPVRRCAAFCGARGTVIARFARPCFTWILARTAWRFRPHPAVPTRRRVRILGRRKLISPNLSRAGPGTRLSEDRPCVIQFVHHSRGCVLIRWVSRETARPASAISAPTELSPGTGLHSRSRLPRTRRLTG